MPKVIGYGWIKSGETLQAAMKKYGVPEEIKEGSTTIKAEKSLASSVTKVRQDFNKAVKSKQNRKSAKPRIFRVVLEEVK